MIFSMQHLRKVYPDGKVALDDFNLELDNGVYGLLGPNGAGKSTLLEILSLNLIPTSGTILYEGRDIEKHSQEFRRVLGYLPQTYGFYGELRAQQMLTYLGSLHGLRGRDLERRIDECLEVVTLKDVRRKKVKTFSGGMKQRLAIAQALLHSPRVLIIDEPTTGLDPGERVAFRNLLFDLGHKCIVLLSTHIVKDVEFSCNLMTLLYRGVQRFTGRPSEFIRDVQGRVFQVNLPFAEFQEFSRAHHVVAIQEHGGMVETRFIGESDQVDVPQAMPVAANLEDAYIDFIGRQQQEVRLDETE